MNSLPQENMEMVQPAEPTEETDQELGLSPEQIALYEETAIKKMMLLSAEMKDWLQENFGVGQVPPEQVEQKIKAMKAETIQAHLHDYNSQIVLITRMVDLGTFSAKDQQELLSKWQALHIDQDQVDSISLPSNEAAGELKQHIKQFASDIESSSGLDAMSHVFVEKYKKENGVIVEKSWMDKMRGLFSQDKFDVSSMKSAQEMDIQTKSDADELYDQEIVSTLVNLYQLLEKHNLDATSE
jgi:hypothetical protein